MQLNLSATTGESLQKYREARKAFVALGPASDKSLADDVGVNYRVSLEALVRTLTTIRPSI
ncbi:hypothetical protein [Pseudomonas sp. DP16D-R1]|jgi:hypothetical protein|uniref:hypothetical protein n=1 Tax=Pseudomonas sp. DP16D-R1 TaxID=2075551 RepID=UPI0011AFA7E8|nr:hypothetical protein [Pseudomonas sp. DP16D-R1]